jgi:hypothetical protein
MGAISLLFWKLYGDWKTVGSTESYLNNTTPLDRLKFNAVFIFLSACLLLNFLLFGYLLICKIVVQSPFD